MEQTSRIAGEIESRLPEVVALWRESRPSEAEDTSFERLCENIERVTLVFVEFIRSPESVETFSRGGATQRLVRELAGHQRELGRDAVGVMEDFAALRRAVLVTVERAVDFSNLDGPEVASFFGKTIAASDWVTHAGLQAFEVLEREALREAIGRAAATDLVTGLPNRDLFNRLLMPNAISEHERFSLLVFDVADFSETVASGKVKQARKSLRRLAQTVKRSSPESALCARFGDDEICALLPESDGETAYKFAEDVLERLAAESPSFQVDVGVAEYPDSGATEEDVVSEATKALRLAKRAGGGGIMVAH